MFFLKPTGTQPVSFSLQDLCSLIPPVAAVKGYATSIIVLLTEDSCAARHATLMQVGQRLWTKWTARTHLTLHSTFAPLHSHTYACYPAKISVKNVVHARENRLTLVHHVPKLQSFEFHTHAYLGVEISAFISVL